MRGLNLVGVLLLGPASMAAQGTVVEAVNSITPQDIIRRIGVIAHDSMRGRDTPSPGLDMTAEWIAREFEAMGLGPGGGGTPGRSSSGTHCGAPVSGWRPRASRCPAAARSTSLPTPRGYAAERPVPTA